MNTKLTLRMDESLIASAKDYAAAHGSSVSQMVANYFAALGNSVAYQAHTAKAATGPQAESPDDWSNESGPVTRSLVGILKAKPGQTQVSEDDYHTYLERKYLSSDGTSQTGAPT
jgi:hypothetical protein